jgi:acyl-CoA thioesterase-1
MTCSGDSSQISLARRSRRFYATSKPGELCGVRSQPSLGDEYKSAFAAMFSGLASEHNVLFYPAFDDAFVDNAQLKLLDGLHPTAAGIEAVVTRILPKVEALIDRARRRDR